ncbi:MAG: hypothetical protein V3V11_07720 [Vicinamibacteria bacterium]
MTSVDPNMVRALVRQALEQELGLGPTSPRRTTLTRRLAPLIAAPHVLTPAVPKREKEAGPNPLSVHPSQFAISDGPAFSDCYEDMDLPLQPPCLIEPHRLCYNSGYCRKLGH